MQCWYHLKCLEIKLGKETAKKKKKGIIGRAVNKKETFGDRMGAGWVDWSAAPLTDVSGTRPRMWRISQGTS